VIKTAGKTIFNFPVTRLRKPAILGGFFIVRKAARLVTFARSAKGRLKWALQITNVDVNSGAMDGYSMIYKSSTQMSSDHLAR